MALLNTHLKRIFYVNYPYSLKLNRIGYIGEIFRHIANTNHLYGPEIFEMINKGFVKISHKKALEAALQLNDTILSKTAKEKLKKKLK